MFDNDVIFEINKLFHIKLGVHYFLQLKLNGQSSVLRRFLPAGWFTFQINLQVFDQNMVKHSLILLSKFLLVSFNKLVFHPLTHKIEVGIH